MRYPLLALLCVALTSCATGGGTDTPDKSTAYKWPKSKGTVKIKDTIILNSSTKDYGMKTVDGAGLTGNGDQKENQEPPFDLKGSGSKLKNAIGKNWPESVHVHGKNALIEEVYIDNVGEDAVSTFTGTDNLIIRNCAFQGAEDKIIQLNQGKNILIENCYFRGFKSAIRIKKGTGKVTIKGCVFVDGTGAVVLDKGVSKPSVTNCSYQNVQYKLRQ